MFFFDRDRPKESVFLGVHLFSLEIFCARSVPRIGRNVNIPNRLEIGNFKSAERARRPTDFHAKRENNIVTFYIVGGCARSLNKRRCFRTVDTFPKGNCVEDGGKSSRAVLSRSHGPRGLGRRVGQPSRFYGFLRHSTW
jgi:hypothetical protein